LFTPGEELSAVARKFADGNGYYENYNGAIFLDSSKAHQFHIKSKLVLGTEKVPFLESFPLMKKLSIDLGGSSGGYGSQKHPTVFKSGNDSSRIAPIICYESIYGEYVTEYTQQGANIFAIITNDGWWENTPGHRQHFAYARLRAIENRRAIVRSANTGISAIINQKGEVLEQTEWWEPAVIASKVQLNSTITFYVRYGDYIGRIFGFLAPLILLLTVVKSLNKTGKRLNKKKM
jgi:apolipoprotein N-acyltransferase